MCWYRVVYLDTLLILGRMKLCVKASLLREVRPSAASTLLMNFRQKVKQLWSSWWNLSRPGQIQEGGRKEEELWLLVWWWLGMQEVISTLRSTYRVSALKLAGCGFDPWPDQTQDWMPPYLGWVFGIGIGGLDQVVLLRYSTVAAHCCLQGWWIKYWGQILNTSGCRSLWDFILWTKSQIHFL